MSIYPNVTEEDLFIVRKLAEQQKNQRALKIENRILKQTHDIKVAESLSPITKKLDTINENTKKIGKAIKEPNSEKEIVPVKNESKDESIHTNLRALPNSSIFSEMMTKTFCSLMSSSNSMKKSSLSGAATFGVPIFTLGGDRMRINDKLYDITPKIHKAFSSTSYTNKTM